MLFPYMRPTITYTFCGLLLAQQFHSSRDEVVFALNGLKFFCVDKLDTVTIGRIEFLKLLQKLHIDKKRKVSTKRICFLKYNLPLRFQSRIS